MKPPHGRRIGPDYAIKQRAGRSLLSAIKMTEEWYAPLDSIQHHKLSLPRWARYGAGAANVVTSLQSGEEKAR
ncbi:unnamed protein product [Chondrus crispus]|uniref:Uncharacterized protein n=1 Tax=Chondrus crispus TaxID=2769 RepID=R7QQX1_CHOCR|nr:unnamed protein product [Chondrus crispus]CDF40499.1 unnamed protein product [Chondrus crispus]|eukprot:XP_005710793.1 unnamed protein product [Chondrus crispus]